MVYIYGGDDDGDDGGHRHFRCRMHLDDGYAPRCTDAVLLLLLPPSAAGHDAQFAAAVHLCLECCLVQLP